MNQWLRKVLFILIAIPLTLHVIWMFSPKKPLRVFILDKTVLDRRCQEHRSFNWLLTHWRYCRDDHRLYHTHRDYFGFFPKGNRRYEINDLSALSGERADHFADRYDMAYVTDTYGVYRQEWDKRVVIGDFSSKIYGGMDSTEAHVLARMKARNKLVILEYNSIASPTAGWVRSRVEDTFGINWTGWSGRYFDSLDSLVNRELPKWMIRRYEQQCRKPWQFRNPGMVFIHLNGRIAVIETPDDAESPLPVITVDQPWRDAYHLPESLNYPYWFDITFPKGDSLEVMAHYHLRTTARGDTILAHAGIPKVFPAMMRCRDRFFYFSGDFADNRVTSWPAYLKWSEYIAIPGKYLPESMANRARFFWDFYVPLMRKILHDYAATL